MIQSCILNQLKDEASNTTIHTTGGNIGIYHLSHWDVLWHECIYLQIPWLQIPVAMCSRRRRSHRTKEHTNLFIFGWMQSQVLSRVIRICWKSWRATIGNKPHPQHLTQKVGSTTFMIPHTMDQKSSQLPATRLHYQRLHWHVCDNL